MNEQLSLVPDLVCPNYDELISEMLTHPQADCPVEHIFGPGLYIRQVTLPKGAWAVGHWQNYSHMNVMLKGKVAMYAEDGTQTILTAPLTFMGNPGRKAGFVLEEVVWQNIYATDERDVEKLEATYLTKTEVYYEARQKLLTDSRQEDKDSYNDLIAELGLTEEQVRAQTEQTNDQIPLPNGNFKFQLSDSQIEGKGIFATSAINKGEIIGPGRLLGKRTILGRYTNHAKTPNAVMVASIDGNTANIWLVALRDIQGQKGPYVGEEITIDYRFTHWLNTQLALGEIK